MDAAVYVQRGLRGTCAIALFASVLARHLLVHGAFVRQQVALLSELLLARVHIARERLRKCVRNAVLFEICFLIESLLAQITSKRRSVVHALVGDQIVSLLVCFVTMRAFKRLHTFPVLVNLPMFSNKTAFVLL